MKTLVVKFDNYAGKDYHYVVADDVKVVVGNSAVVHNGSEFRVVKVTDILAGASARATKTVVTILNEDTMAVYKEANEKVKAQKELFVRLEQLLCPSFDSYFDLVVCFV